MKAKVVHVATIEGSIRGILANKLVGLKKLGYDVITVASGSGRSVVNLQEKGIAFHPVPMSRHIAPLADLRAMVRMRALFRDLKPDIVHTHTAKAGFIGRVAARLAGVPIVAHTAHGLPFYDGQPYFVYNLYRYLESFAARQADLLLSQNREDKATMEQLLDQNVIYEGNGIDIGHFDGLSRISGTAKRAELGIGNDRFVIGVFARFEPVKEHLFFIRAIAKVVKEYPQMLCLLAGKGPLEPRIKHVVKEYGLEKNVRFLGFRRDVPELMKAIDVLALTSRKEGIPRVVMEAMAARVPVVASDVLGSREVVAHGETGLLFEWRNEGAFVSAVCAMIDNPQLRGRMGAAGRKRVETYFNEDDCVKVLDQVYKEALARRER